MGQICGKESPPEFTELEAGEQAGVKVAKAEVNNASEHSAAGLSSRNTDPVAAPAADSSLLLKKIKDLEAENTRLRNDLARAREDPNNLSRLQVSLASLQKENEELRQQALECQRKLEEASTSLEQQLSCQKILEQNFQDLNSRYERSQLQNQQLTRRVSDLATGHADETVYHVQDESDEKLRVILTALKTANRSSKLSILWKGHDIRKWEGVRFENNLITGLALNNLQLIALPPELGELTSLTALLLSNNQLTELPPAIGNLKELSYLVVDGNRLVTLPPELLKLRKLQTLWLQDNELTAVPEGLGQLVALRQLLLNDNQLTSLPESIGELRHLCSLWLDNNKFSTLPGTMTKLTSLHRLRVDGNQLTFVPAELQLLVEAGGSDGAGPSSEPVA